jgi:hypothetical protein
LTDTSTQRSFDENSFDFGVLLDPKDDLIIPSKKYPKLKLDLKGFPGVETEPNEEIKKSASSKKLDKNETNNL